MIQLTGLAIISDSKDLPMEIKEAVMEASKGKIKRIRAKLKEADGSTTMLSGRLQLSEDGSLMARFAMKVENYELVEIDDPRIERTKEERKEAKVNKLAAELLTATSA